MTFNFFSAKKRSESPSKVATSFDELWNEHEAKSKESGSPKKSRHQSDIRSAWANVGLVSDY